MLSLENGKLKFEVKYGRRGKTVTIVSDNNYNNNLEHEVKVDKIYNEIPERFTLQVDSGPVKTRTVDLGNDPDILDTADAPLYLGGAPGESGITGCVSWMFVWNTGEDRNFGSDSSRALYRGSRSFGATCSESCESLSSRKQAQPVQTQTTEDDSWGFFG